MFVESETQSIQASDEVFIFKRNKQKSKNNVAIRLRRNIYNESKLGPFDCLDSRFIFIRFLSPDQRTGMREAFAELNLMFTFIWEANCSYAVKLRHRFLIRINVYLFDVLILSFTFY